MPGFVPCRKQHKVKVEWGMGGMSTSPLLMKKVLISRMTIVAFEIGPVEEGGILFSPESSAAGRSERRASAMFVLGRTAFNSLPA